MSYKKRLLTVIFTVIIISGLLFYLHSLQKPEKIHFHAGFLVYLDGELQDFSGDKYMELNTCEKPLGIKSAAQIQQDKAHLHENIADVVHVHEKGALWQDLFTNIGFEIPAGKTVRGYIGGKPITDILRKEIKPYESVIITIGNDNIDKTRYVTIEHIKEIEAKSELCG